jgi:hypothetical protein
VGVVHVEAGLDPPENIEQTNTRSQDDGNENEPFSPLEQRVDQERRVGPTEDHQHEVLADDVRSAYPSLALAYQRCLP